MQSIDKLTLFTTDFLSGAAKIFAQARKVIFFSPSDDLVYPRNNFTAAIDKGCVSAAFGSRFLSVVTLKGTRDYLFDDDRYPQPEELASSLTLAMGELGASRADITLTIPKSWAIIKTVEFPSTVKENLADVLMYEMDRITPFISGEAYYDFRIVGEGGGRISVLVIAARADAVMPYLIALNEKGIRVTRLMVDLQALVLFSQRLVNRPDSLFLKIDRSGYEGALQLSNKLNAVFSGSFAEGEGRDRAEAVSFEVKALMEQARAKNPALVVLLKDKDPSFKELLKSRLPDARFLGEMDIRMRLASPVRELPFNAVAGLYQGLQPERLQFNLLRKGITVKEKTPFVFSLLLLLGILAAAGLYIVAPLRVEQKRLQDISSQIASQKDEVKKVQGLMTDVEALQGEIDTISGFKKPEPVTLNILKEVTTVLPKTAWVTRMKITGTTVDIEGYAASANELLPKLEASSLLRKVEFSSPTFRDAKMNADRFVIKMEIEGAKKPEPQPQPQAQAQPQAKPQAKPQPQVQAQPQVKPQAQSKGAPAKNEKK